MAFIVKKDSGVIPQVLSAILDECVNGVTLADPDLDDCPIIYANKSFEKLTGYGQNDVIGRNCRFLQGADREQPARYQLAEAIKNHVPAEVILRNYKKDGTLFHNHLKVTPLFDHKQQVIYYLGIQYDVTLQVNSAKEIELLTGIIDSMSKV
ncbi:MAG: PAS domain-containing protein [Methylomonas sp.]|nr:PAS domain-containing protein [Methylomonas sp.]PPD22049.1 MAG: PAS sensor protein [Methylomonas sp.]PPD25241.1 MAG: PAS sensor protein [Methylomonas sp.]PPD35192.1 MAG: PAS sensor protein [Methylomonas sp.]PPD42463.1 MAG: PAS sensor protein [Methylomonas sp.]